MRTLAPTLMLAFASVYAQGQVMQNTNYEREMAHAKSLLAGATSNDVAHHVHYDLKLHDREGHESTATYDIYRDPNMHERIEVKADNYQLTRISNLHNNKQWQHYTGDIPLKIVDFDGVRDIPKAAVDRFRTEPGSIDAMHREQLEGAPLLCANDNDGTAICFNPLIRIFAYAQMFNRTIMYDQWLPIGSHPVAGAIRIYEDKKLIVEATGTVEAVKTFPENFMEIPDTPSQPTQQSKILKSKKMDLSQPRYGYVQIAVSVDEKGHVTKESVIDSDDKHLEGAIRKYARKIVFEPQMKDGQPSPFEAVLYLEYYPS